jgi:hypothetical protein
MTKDEALKLALEALENQRIFTLRPDHEGKELTPKQVLDAIATIKQALAAPAQEHKELFGYEIFGHFYRDKEELLEAFVDKGIQWATPNGPFNGMNEEWVKANIREVYVHGVTALAKREAG